MKKIHIQIATIIFSSIILFSCQNDENGLELSKNTDATLAQKYARFLMSETAEGTILIQSNATLNAQSKNTNIGFSELSFNKKGKNTSKISFKNQKSINLFSADKNNKQNLELVSFFGKTTQYTTQSSNGRVTDEGVYIPELLNITVNTSDIRVGTVLSWNIDEDNENGVAVRVKYNPASQPNVRLAFDNAQTITEAVVISDLNGSYTVTQEDLDRFPNGSFLSVDVMRAGFELNENEEPILAGMTAVNTDLQLVK